MQQRSLDQMAGARVMRMAVWVSTEGNSDVVTVCWLAMLQDRLHDMVPERVPAELAGSGQHLAQELRQARAAPGMFQQAADDAAAKPVARHCAAPASQLFRDEARERCGHDLHNLLDHVVCVRRLDGRPDMAVQLRKQLSCFLAVSHLQRKLHNAATGCGEGATQHCALQSSQSCSSGFATRLQTRCQFFATLRLSLRVAGRSTVGQGSQARCLATSRSAMAAQAPLGTLAQPWHFLLPHLGIDFCPLLHLDLVDAES
mmetsp:Transcript_87473/g.271719  ORF Transcript_87473/g.271719 Transcript_87473/m.271719 type:complete len:258 (-) Transcript_87473:580-1353(-)